MRAFPNRILFVGFGAVARCTLPILLKHLSVDPKNITISAAPAGVFPQFDLIDPHPTPGGGFGTPTVLSNGNIVVTNSNDDFGGSSAGAVYLFDGFTGALISALVGSHPGDY